MKKKSVIIVLILIIAIILTIILIFNRKVPIDTSNNTNNILIDNKYTEVTINPGEKVEAKDEKVNIIEPHS